MGNQITAKTPYEILPVDKYVALLPKHQFEKSLGSTRFLKVAKAKSSEGEVVIKVFVIHDPSLSLRPYTKQTDEIILKLSGATNCLPFQQHVSTDKAGFLVRQYIKYNLYDRISTRPFFTPIEKKWIAFQLLCALNQCANHNICHGDVKTENIVITSWNWVLLTDFAYFKPTFLPENNPSDYNYFFDTSRRRTCYIAPERFTDGSTKSSEPGGFDINESPIQGELTHAMDIFSLGCVLIELFSEGRIPFTLAQLLQYRRGDYSPWKILESINDRNVKEMLESMIQKDPAHRLTADDYLNQQKGRAFPSYFYTYLKIYLQNFRLISILPDDRVAKIKKDFQTIVKMTGASKGQDGEYEPILLIHEVIAAAIRELKFCESKLASLTLLLEFSEFFPADITLDRILPHMMYLIEDKSDRVKAEAIRCITQVLSSIKYVPKGEVNVFPDYILPAMNSLSTHNSVLVRKALAENIATLAETAVRFLDISQVSVDDSESGSHVNYEREMGLLHEAIETKVVSLISDQDSSVKMSMMRHSIIRLAVILGKQKASDIILSHMITYLNDKKDWLLRAEFFQCIVGVAAYIGWQSTAVLKPILEQGINDSEEFVVRRSLEALDKLFSLNLIQKSVVLHLLRTIGPLLCHPNEWIRYCAAQCISTISCKWSVADVHCSVLPVIKLYLKTPALQINKLEVLLHSLHSAIPRHALEYLTKCPSANLDKYLDYLQDKQLHKSITRPGHALVVPVTDTVVTQVCKKLSSLGLIEEQEEILLSMREYIKHHSMIRQGDQEKSVTPAGKIDISNMRVQRRHADLVKQDGKDSVPQTASKVLTSPRSKQSLDMSTQLQAPPDVRSLFGDTDILDSSKAHPIGMQPLQGQVNRSSSPARLVQERNNTVQTTPDRPRTPVKQLKQQQGQITLRASGGNHQLYKHSQCKLDLRTLVHHKRDEYNDDYRNKELMDNILNESLSVRPDWRPKGVLVAHIYEHKESVTKILVHPSQSYYLTSSKDGSIKIWECYRADSNNNTTRSRNTYTLKQGNRISDMVFCTADSWIACLTSQNTIQLVNIETEQQSNLLKFEEKLSHDINNQSTGQVVALEKTEYGPKTVIHYATVQGGLYAWDIRANKIVWKLKHDLPTGLVTCMASHPQEKWLAVGTARGCICVYDMRFQLRVNTLLHPAGFCMKKLVHHPTESSWIIGSVAGNNEVTMWNMETKQRQNSLWASPSPLFSSKEFSKHWANGIHIHQMADSSMFMLTAGTDMRIRYWNLSSPSESRIVTHTPLDTNHTIAYYKSQCVDGIDCIVETYNKSKVPVAAMSAATGSVTRPQDKPHPGHHDVITDVALYQTSEPFIVSGSAEGVVKVWK